MRIGVLGNTGMGRSLASGFAMVGHTVVLGARNPRQESLLAWAEHAGRKISIAGFDEAAAFGEIIVLTRAWSGLKQSLDEAGADNLAGKIVIDATNPFTNGQHLLPRLILGHTDSGGEQIQRWLPGSRVVKAFNCMPPRQVVEPSFPGGPPDMFICGNDADARATVAGLCQSIGWHAIDLGGIEASRLIEPMALLWTALHFDSHSHNIAFKLLRK